MGGEKLEAKQQSHNILENKGLCGLLVEILMDAVINVRITEHIKECRYCAKRAAEILEHFVENELS